MKKAVMKRLLPLYVGKFFLSFVLWYSIEKLFIRSIEALVPIVAEVVVEYIVEGIKEGF